ncbi:MAG: cyclic lactone autoinducer peptide [Eubacterium sp.]|nr:cyclic lactone autoinducer peptide [Eubacterium sp.]
MKTTSKENLAKKVANWLKKDLRLNAGAASSPHFYEPKVPEELKMYLKKND